MHESVYIQSRRNRPVAAVRGCTLSMSRTAQGNCGIRICCPKPGRLALCAVWFLKEVEDMKRITKLAAVAGFSAVLGLMSSASKAATVVSDIGGSGWTATFSGLSLTSDPTQSAGQLDVEKAATFSAANAGEGLLITFTQTSASAKGLIDFTNESITNVTGSTWSGFDFILLNSNADASFVSSANSP